MPWSAKQLKLFRAAAHNPAFAKKVGIKQAEAERMSKEGLKLSAGGNVAESKAMVKKEVEFFKRKGAPASMIKHEEAELNQMKRGGQVKKKFADGGMPVQAQGVPVRGVPPRRPMPVQAQGVPVRGGIPAVRPPVVPVPVARGPVVPVPAVRPAMKKGGAVKKMKCGGKTKMASGGSVGARGDGCASKGKTKGRVC